MPTLKRFYQLIAPFWFTRRAVYSWLLLLTIIALTLSVVWISVLYNNWSKDFYDALADYFQHASIQALAWRYAGYTALFVLVIVCGNWLKKLLIIRCRQDMTQHFSQAWLTRCAHYRLSLRGEPDNPDQRIAEDIRLLIEQSLELLLSLLKNIARFFSFIVILWQLSGVQTFTVGGHGITVHGYLVWIALGYALVNSLFAHLLGHRLHGLNVEKQRAEANYRTTLLRVREHTEQIAFYRGEEAEQTRMSQRFQAIVNNWRSLMGREFRLESFITSYFRLSLMIPVFAILPVYLARQITLGAVMQASTAFGYVLDAFGWFIDAYRQLVAWSATIERLWEFQHSLRRLPNLNVAPRAGDALHIEALSVQLPDGAPLFAPLTATLKAGDWAVLSAASGSGKTTLLRALAGLWPAVQGQWRLPAGKTLFLPQKPYLPQDTLRRALCYPLTETPDNASLHRALKQVGLPSLIARLDESSNWSRELSGGEQQRLSLARVLLLHPTLLCLDEATSQLDDDAALQLLTRLRQALPRMIVLAVSHQPAVCARFEHRFSLTPCRR
ncbi:MULTISPECIES: ABC transporter ATP-binding protein/permease [unclassified Brenneria]|uniref:ABC transporter ATP-binding protein/permease n=1 Tax=unclassified Brenneria TaxID=2634434 RepID=UPI00155498B4|nr:MULTISPECIES: ABC transporter ATP-binding protein/permease [unclassified Brenneria]MBJ7222618.1 ABC transporter ATP-binding protein/permease [Brenneria sp. L3-3C-1]MEE3643861.1 ABC transporter ATP-binding protein/permease [Brenneria sp. L3_3C_1]MEE3651186.1 ABC transporter ATP-binding protein/permease [Brenneria sp. HEZEL_4_2_4]NPD01141.1 ABC transporter ATP-binding protein/permease [Brenneria sp. hezel4-2-4]